MAAPRDKFGRPIVVVTGMGVVTSLGAGKTDNWAKLTAGESGIRTVTRFPIDGLKTTMAGTVDFVTRRSVLLDRPLRAPRQNGDRGSARTGRHRQQGRFSRAAVSCGGAGRDRMAAAARGRPRHRQRPTSTIYDMLRVSGGGKFAEYHHRFMFGSVASSSGRNLRHQGIADFALDRLRLRRHRDPARRRSDPPRRSRCRAVRRDRRLGQSGSAGAVLAAVGAVDPERSAARAPQSRSRRTATASSWRKAPARWCWKATRPRWRAARRSSASSPAAAN